MTRTNALIEAMKEYKKEEYIGNLIDKHPEMLFQIDSSGNYPIHIAIGMKNLQVVNKIVTYLNNSNFLLNMPNSHGRKASDMVSTVMDVIDTDIRECLTKIEPLEPQLKLSTETITETQKDKIKLDIKTIEDKIERLNKEKQDWHKIKHLSNKKNPNHYHKLIFQLIEKIEKLDANCQSNASDALITLVGELALIEFPNKGVTDTLSITKQRQNAIKKFTNNKDAMAETNSFRQVSIKSICASLLSFLGINKNYFFATATKAKIDKLSKLADSYDETVNNGQNHSSVR